MKPPPWTDGRDPYATLEVYLPPGYDASPGRRYPVLYEVPWTFESWQEAIGIRSILDGLIDSGRIRPLIVVFAAHNGAPDPDSECVDSVDGRQQLETYITRTVVDFVDATYRTIATPDARALFGFSQGGYCAPMLLLRHPDIFRQAIALSGYFQAGIRTRVTPDAWRPFGRSATAIADHSPLSLAGGLAAAVRSRLFIVLSANPREWLYGPQYQRFASVLRADGYPLALMPSALGHAWSGVRATFPLALGAVARRWTALGVG
jgi:enterochelin esterase-like enzyme